ncbi:50S ribosomal protein L13 [Candidatus Amesbacteria bacterium RIFCSPLOWO2_02_FULL_48_11]|uniref:Large ribosomal subunit protein uL13 n=5 Tax=Candidatus Amesiibacteriota TaxID=1752730 RepID=A0A1F4ZFD6_9BACT|nr:MAG: 50S ribosomal protein L13 [Candidatus Amesbacteria bacterium GW2011_GWA2_47_11]KKU94578.1 MAG: 50S ribosomal protein L13 [Candidatus Amesbacteria bacterium GW2011_GWC1_48_10]KKW00364.1 MAG: 50S ribosomal protein L13 [Candidatus Amesbacteria bacterium GW2011_GWA1_48_9]OGC89667.1 MAG: 50S ribosomal protein L13 [Candidatus Amesbacteria bacterium RBG_19FT_COMBO_48_16]OGC96804.1 MAG: 50S ribosomal protein L13 [Candidatus Amesbacteria bacterium RBG_16_48_31]OGC96932.1 MAG: 50S ribosomal prot
MQTLSPSSGQTTRTWYFFDARDQILGRLAVQIASILMGKHKTSFVRHLDIGDHIVVVNAGLVKVSGRKEQQKIYHRHSGYPGGMKITSLKILRQTHPERIIIHAVSGMLPDNKLKARLLKHLHVYPGPDHPYQSQFKNSEIKN